MTGDLSELSEGRDVIVVGLPPGQSGAVPFLLFYFPLEGTPLRMLRPAVDGAADRLADDLARRLPTFAEPVHALMRAFDARDDEEVRQVG